MVYAIKRSKYSGAANKSGKKPNSFEKRVFKVVKNQEEPKYMDRAFQVSSYDPASPGFVKVQPIIDIRPGTSNFQRIGNDLYAKYLIIRGYVYVETTNNLPQMVRMQIVLDREFHNVVPAANVINASSGVLAHYSYDYKSRFKTLYDQYITLPSSGNTDKQMVPFVVKIPLKMPIKFNQSTGSELDVYENQLLMVTNTTAISQATSATFSYVAHIRYSDN